MSDDRYAVLHGGRVCDLVEFPAGSRLGVDVVHPDYVADYIALGSRSVTLGMVYAEGEFRSPPTPEVDLAELKTCLKSAIDAAAEAERLKYITGGAGQAMTYARKVEQARAAQVDADPEPDDYPLLKASIGIDGEDVLAVAATILAMDAAWEQIGSAIEAARLCAKRAVDEAETTEEVRAVTAVWPNG